LFQHWGWHPRARIPTFQKFTPRDFHFNAIVLAVLDGKSPCLSKDAEAARGKTTLGANIFGVCEQIHTLEWSRIEQMTDQQQHRFTTIALAPFRRFADDDPEFAVAMIPVNRKATDAANQCAILG
jgi:hypothetical protein